MTDPQKDDPNRRIRKNYVPRIMLGDPRKNNCEFNSDLNLMNHQTHIVVKRNTESNTKKSKSLKQMHMKELAMLASKEK